MFELLVVLLIIGLMSAVVLPRVAGNFGTLELKADVKKVASALRYARSRAAAESVTFIARFDPVAGQVNILKEAPEEAIEDIRITPDNNKEIPPVFTYDLADGVSIESAVQRGGESASGQFEVHFYPGGSSSGGTVVFGNSREQRYEITIDYITGSVKVM